MKVEYERKYTQCYYTCDLCGEKVVQDGKDICLIYDRDIKGKKSWDSVMHFHESCLLRHFDYDPIKGK